MIIDHDKVMEAKEILGDRNATLMSEMLQLEDYDENNMKALCCFHHEDTPSLIYNPKNYTFHCFGCQKTVDILDVYMQTQHLTYIEAVQKLFEEAGIHYSFGEANVRTRHQYIYPQEVSKDNDMTQVYEYMASRGISKETVDYLDIRSDGEGNMVYNYYDTNDVLTNVKYRPARKVRKGTNKCWAQKGADTTPLLYNSNRINAGEPLVISEGECFPGVVEVMTPDGWVKLQDYHNQPVMQVNEKMEGSFVTPLAYIKKPYQGDMVSCSIGGNYFTETTAGHNLVLTNSKGKVVKKKAAEHISSIYRIPTTIKHNGLGGKWSNDEIALYLAVSADATIDVRKGTGTIKPSTKYYARFNLTKQRKVDRLRGILDRLGLRYTDHILTDLSKHTPQYHSICVDLPDTINSKYLPWWFVTETTLEQKEFILQEMAEWDGNRVPNRNQYEYSSKLKHNTDVIQAVASTCGYMSTIMLRSKVMPESGNLCYWYKVSILFNKQYVSAQCFEKNKKTSSANMTVYCVTVPTGMILVRQDNKISVSGNCDTAALIESGIHNAVSVPFGAGNFTWIQENWDWLEQFDNIIICSDNDEPGIKMQKECVYRLGSWRTKVVDIPQTVTSQFTGRKVAVKDVNEVLYYCGKEAVVNLIANAKDTPVPSLIDFADVKEIDLSDIEGITVGINEIDKEIMRLFYSSLTILSGTPGSGKTSFLCQLAAQSIDQDKPVWMFSREMPDWLTKNWIEYILAGNRHITQFQSNSGAAYWKVNEDAKREISRHYREQLMIYRDQFSNKLQDLQTSMEDSARKYGSKLFIIDNLMTVDLDATSESMNEKQTEFVQWLIQFAMKYNVATVLVCHPRKLQPGVTNVGMYDISGTSNIINLAHRAFGLKRVTKAEKEGVRKLDNSGWKVKPVKYDVRFEIIKDRLRGKSNLEVGLYYDVPSRRFFTTPEEYEHQYLWDKNVYKDHLPYPITNDSEVFG